VSDGCDDEKSFSFLPSKGEAVTEDRRREKRPNIERLELGVPAQPPAKGIAIGTKPVADDMIKDPAEIGQAGEGDPLGSEDEVVPVLTKKRNAPTTQPGFNTSLNIEDPPQ
jgi:hypothetical protein